MRGNMLPTDKRAQWNKIILITAYDIDDILLKDLEENNCITKCIEKPIHLRSLMDLVAE